MLQSYKAYSAKDYFAVTIPVKTYVRKYIEARYSQPMVISLNNYLGTVIFSYISKTNHNIIKSSVLHTELRYNLLTDFIRILIPRHLVNSYNIGLSIPLVKAVLLNNLFEEKISEDIHTYCLAYNKSGRPQSQAIRSFCLDHNIDLEIDISYTAFRKAEYRHKKKLIIPAEFVPKNRHFGA